VTAVSEHALAKVTGIGGVFFEAKDPEALQDWDARHRSLNHPAKSH
jgi:hypothetical protein